MPRRASVFTTSSPGARRASMANVNIVVQDQTMVSALRRAAVLDPAALAAQLAAQLSLAQLYAAGARAAAVFGASGSLALSFAPASGLAGFRAAAAPAFETDPAAYDLRARFVADSLFQTTNLLRVANLAFGPRADVPPFALLPAAAARSSATAPLRHAAACLVPSAGAGAIDFCGGAAGLPLPASAAGSAQPCTLACWVRAASGAGSTVFYAYNSAGTTLDLQTVAIDPSGATTSNLQLAVVLKFRGAATATAYSAGAFAPNTWVHLALVFDGAGNLALYLNGAALHTLASTNCLFDAAYPYNTFGSSYAGALDDLRVYYRAFPAPLVAALAAAPPSAQTLAPDASTASFSGLVPGAPYQLALTPLLPPADNPLPAAALLSNLAYPSS